MTTSQTGAGRVDLSAADLDFLTENVSDDGLRETFRRSREAHVFGGDVDRPVSVVLERHEVATLLHELGSLLCAIGLRTDGERNPKGLAIEALIDKVYAAGPPSS